MAYFIPLRIARPQSLAATLRHPETKAGISCVASNKHRGTDLKEEHIITTN